MNVTREAMVMQYGCCVLYF